MNLAFGTDERTPVTDAVVALLRAQGHSLLLVGPQAGEQDAWPAVARGVAEQVACGAVAEGILFCWTGTGVSIAANKVPGIRAALCGDAETARGARLWNDANVLCLSLRLTTAAVAEEILSAWFSHVYQPNDTDNACLAQVAALEARYRAQSPIDEKAPQA
jgi:ribose 5-phosphate isomerase B